MREEMITSDHLRLRWILWKDGEYLGTMTGSIKGLKNLGDGKAVEPLLAAHPEATRIDTLLELETKELYPIEKVRT